MASPPPRSSASLRGLSGNCSAASGETVRTLGSPPLTVRYGDAEACAIRRADRLELAPRASHLGSEIGPRDVSPPTPERPAARRTHAATLVPPGRACPRAGGAAARRQVPAGRTSPPGLADGCVQTDDAPDRPRVCGLRIVNEGSGVILWTAVFPLGSGGLKSRRRRSSATPPGLRPLGTARAVPDGQRRALRLVPSMSCSTRRFASGSSQIEEGRQLGRQAATKIRREDIMGLTVSYRDEVT